MVRFRVKVSGYKRKVNILTRNTGTAWDVVDRVRVRFRVKVTGTSWDV